jgi:hypothetical protein
MVSIDFHDADGLGWRVVPQPAPAPEAPGNMTLVFTSERGERRTCDARLPEGGTWEDVDERVWCALLRHAEVMAAGANGS